MRNSMVFSRAARLLLLLVAAMSVVSADRALAGPRSPGGSGGGSMVGGRLVEEFISHDGLSQLRGFDLAMADLRALVPRWTTQQIERMEARTLIILPIVIRELPSEVTDLYFQTENPCYQTQREFVCDRRVRSMPIETLRRFFKHEAVVAAHLASRGQTTPPDVRNVVDVLINRRGVSYLQFVNALVENRFTYSPFAAGLEPPEYVASIGRPQGTATMPTWATAAPKRCSLIAQGLESTIPRVRIQDVQLNYDRVALFGDGLAVYDGYLYRAQSFLSSDYRRLPDGLLYWNLTRELPSQEAEIVHLLCGR